MSYMARAERIIEDQRMPGHHRSQHLHILGNILWDQRKVEESLNRFREAAQVARGASSRHVFSAVAPRLVEVLLASGKDEEALPYMLEAAAAFAELKDQRQEADMWSTAARLLERQPKRTDEAARAWARARDLRRLIPDRSGEVEALEGLGRVARAGDPAAGLGYYREALTLALELGQARKAGEILNSMGIIEWRQARYADALSYYEQALRLFERSDDPRAAGLILNSLGVTLKCLGRPQEAEAYLLRAVELNRQIGNQLLEGHALAALGDLAREQGRLEEALRHYETSLQIRRAIPDPKGEGWMLLRCAQVQWRRGSVAESRDLVERAAAAAGVCADRELGDECRELQARWAKQ
jgi:tetratricopeptide (TPR) repeat protein